MEQPTTTDRIAVAGEMAQKHLDAFDTLDFEVFTNQQWNRFHESHTDNVVVHWPDGHTTNGLARHIEDMKDLFVYAPDTRIREHPVRIAAAEWTSVIGVMEGTFTKPMATPDGKSIPPTGKAFKVPMCTVAHWTDGVLDEEYLFWDNATYMSQMGIS